MPHHLHQIQNDIHSKLLVGRFKTAKKRIRRTSVLLKVVLDNFFDGFWCDWWCFFAGPMWLERGHGDDLQALVKKARFCVGTWRPRKTRPSTNDLVKLGLWTCRVSYILKIHFYFLYTMVVYIFIMFMCKRNIKLTYFPSCRIDINITWTCFSSCIQEIKRLLISTILFSEKTIHDYTVEDSGWAIDLDYFTDASSTLQEGCLQAYWIY